MVAISSRFSILALAILVSSVAASKPYAPELESRSDVDAVRREVVASRPYAAELYDRSEDDPIQIQKRGEWSPLDVLDMETRSSTKCHKNSDCSSKSYCYNKKCYKKKDIGSKCHSKNYECQSDYCSVKTDKCRAQASKGGACIVDDGCKAGLDCVNRTCHKPSKTHHHHPSPSGSHNDKRELRSI